MSVYLGLFVPKSVVSGVCHASDLPSSLFPRRLCIPLCMLRGAQDSPGSRTLLATFLLLFVLFTSGVIFAYICLTLDQLRFIISVTRPCYMINLQRQSH
jgi:hypothetical protein